MTGGSVDGGQASHFVPMVITMDVMAKVLVKAFCTGRFSKGGLNVVGASSGGLGTLLHVVSSRCMSAIGVNRLIRSTVPRVLNRLSPRSSCVPTGSLRTMGSSLGKDFDKVNVRFAVRRSAVRMGGIVRNKPSRGINLVTKSHVVRISSDTFMKGVIAGCRSVGELGNPGNDRMGLNIFHPKRGRALRFAVIHNSVPMGDMSTTCVLGSGFNCVGMGGFNRAACPRLLVSLTGLGRTGYRKIIVSLHNGANKCVNTTVRVMGRFLPGGELVICARKHGSPHRGCASGKAKDDRGVPVIMLVSRNSTSTDRVFTKTVRSGSQKAVVKHHSFKGKLMRRPVSFDSNSTVHLAVTHCCAPSKHYVRGPCMGNGSTGCRVSVLAHCRRKRFFSRSDVGRSRDRVFRASLNHPMCKNKNVVPSVFMPRSAANVASCCHVTIGHKLAVRFTFRCASGRHTRVRGCRARRDLLRCLGRRGVLRRFTHFTRGGKLGHHGVLVCGSRGLFRAGLCKGVVCGVLNVRTCVRCLGGDSGAILGTLRMLSGNRSFPGTPRRPVRPGMDSRKAGGAATRTSDTEGTPSQRRQVGGRIHYFT